MSDSPQQQVYTTIERPWGDAWGNAWRKSLSSAKASNHNSLGGLIAESQRDAPWNAIGAVKSQYSSTRLQKGSSAKSDGDRATNGDATIEK